MVRVSFRTGTRYPQAQKKYLFRSGPEKKYFFRKHLKSRILPFFRSGPKKVPFSVFSKPQAQKNTFFVPDRKKVKKASLKPQKSTFCVAERKTVPFFGVFQASKKKYPFCFGPTFFRLFQASQAKKRYFPAFFQASQVQKRYLFRSRKSFQASQAQKRYLFRCFPSLSSPKRKVPFSVFSKPLKPKQGTFFGVFRTGKIPFSVFSKPLTSQAKKNTLFVPCLPSLSSQKRYLFRSGP